MKNDRLSNEYLEGVEQFLNFAILKASRDGKILCLCVKCVIAYWKNRSDVHDDLVCKGFISNYSC